MRMLLSVMEAAERLRISRAMAYSMISKGELPSVRLGRAVRVPADLLEKWIEENSFYPESSRVRR